MQYPYISMYSRSKPTSTHSTALIPLKGNATENKNFPTYAPAQDHYGNSIHGLIFFVTDS